MRSIVSNRTIAIFAIGVVVIAALAIAIGTGVGGDNISLILSDFGLTAVEFASAAVILWVAFSFAPAEKVRVQWIAIGLGVLLYAVGDAVWAYIEVIKGAEVPYPGAPDIFYLLIYPFLAFGLLRAGLAYRGFVNLGKPAWISAAVVVALAAVVYFSLLKPYVFGADLSSAEKAISAAYPISDLLFALGPALFTLIVVFGLGRGRFAWPWWAVAAGTVLVVLGDSGYAYLTSYGLYESGSVIDYGFVAGFLLMAVGASIFYDLSHSA
jgi:hypothetical protein